MGSADTEDGRPNTPINHGGGDLVPEEGTEKLHPPAPVVDTVSSKPSTPLRARAPEVSGDREEEEEHKSPEPVTKALRGGIRQLKKGAPVEPTASAKLFALTAGSTVKKLNKVQLFEARLLLRSLD